MSTPTLYEQVRQQVEDELRESGNRNPEFWDIHDRINELTNLELLEHISNALETLK